MTIALSIIILSTVIALGKLLGRCKIAGISLGVTWILFVGIIFSHFGFNLNPELLHFVKELGLILFVYSIGMQVGPSFFSSFRSGGIKLNLLSTILVLLGVGTTAALINRHRRPDYGRRNVGSSHQYTRTGCRPAGIRGCQRR